MDGTVASVLASLVLCAPAAVCGIWPQTASALPASFASEGPGAGEVNQPRGIAVEGERGAVYVADEANNRVDKFDAEGNFLLAWGWGVVDGKTEALQVCSSTCFAGLRGSGPGEFKGLEGIAVDNDPFSTSHGDVYVADTANSRIEKFGPQGEFLLMFGSEVDKTTKADLCTEEDLEGGDECGAGVPGEGTGAFQGLTKHSVAVDPSTGTVFVADSIAGGEGRVQRFSSAGIAQSQLDFPGAGVSQNLTVDSAEDIYLKSEELPGVRKYDNVGKELGSARDQAGNGEAKTLAISPASELFVNHLEGESHHVNSYDAEGEQSASFDAGGDSRDGRRGIAYSDSTKALYVLNETMVRIVTPPPPGPLILQDSQSAGEVQSTTSTLRATINPEGPQATSYHFEYDTSAYEGEATHGQSTPATPLAGGEFEDQAASAAVGGLLPGATYHFRAVATNAASTSFGPDETFTTLPAVSIDATSVSEVDDESARLEAELDPHGVASEYRFEYDTTPYAQGESPHGKSVPIPDGSIAATLGDVSVQQPIQGLEPLSTYHYRVVAHNALGEVQGADHAFRTQGLSANLPDGRSYELVSPPNKHGAPLEPITEEGGLIESAPGGGAFTYVAIGPLGEQSKGTRSPEDSQLLSRRDPAMGWSTQDITTPHEELTLVQVGHPAEYRGFAEDLSTSIVEPAGSTLLAPENPANSEPTPYRREADGTFAPLVSTDNVPIGAKFGGIVFFKVATPDLGHIVLSSAQILAPGFSEGFEGGPSNLYELADGKLTLVSVLPNERPAAEEGLSVAVGNNDLNMRGAISNDGRRVFFSTAANQLLMRDTALSKTLQLDQAQPGASGESGGGVFQAASTDGSRAFFTDSSRLTPDATARSGNPDLYMCDIGQSAGQPTCALSDLSIDHNKGEAADVQEQVSAIDRDGGHVYFVAHGALTSSPNSRGEVATPDAFNMYEYDTETRQVQLVAVLSGEDGPDWGEKLYRLTARSSPEGRYFAFMSERSLTGYDNRDANSGQADEEAYLYDAQNGAVRCVSCDPSGARPRGVFVPGRFPGLLVDRPRTWAERWLAGSIPGWTAVSQAVAPYQSRYLSDNGRMFFNAADALVPQDKNEVEDVYEYEPPGVGDCTSESAAFSPSSGGCVSLISSGQSKDESAFLDASEGGDEAYFLTASALTKNDVDDAFDVYDAHVCSASSPCPPLPAPTPGCEGDSCQNPTAPVSETTPSSLTYRGPENAPPLAPSSPIKPQAKPTRAQLLSQALKACKKKPKRKRLACEKQARKKYGPKKAAKARSKHKAKGRKAVRGRGIR